MQIAQQALTVLNKKSVFYFLLAVLLAETFFLFGYNIHYISGDQYTYMNYVKGFQQGRYTYWYFLPQYVPDTFRNPGYPLFLYACSLISESVIFIKMVQLALFSAAIYLMLRISDKYEQPLAVKNLFLFFVILNFVILPYPAFIYPEALMLFLITLIVYFETCIPSDGWKKTIGLALLYGFCFQVRPVIVFIPILRFLLFLFYYKKLSLAKNSVFLLLFVITLLPYGFWNLKHHHQFKITPLEGGAGALYLGYWSPKMVNYATGRYWKNATYKDALINFATDEETSRNIPVFNREWDSIEQLCNKYLTNQDSANLIIMKQHPELFATYNATYTTEREQLLKTIAVNHYLSDFGYSVKLKCYTFFRLWYTGLSLNQYTLMNRFELTRTIIAFIATSATLLLFIGYFLICLIKRRKILAIIWLPLFFCLYFDIFHLPFVIQSRYTIPVRFLYLFSLSFMIYQIHFDKTFKHES